MCVCQTQPQDLLERPITVQAVGTNGRIFQFLVFQLNTTDLSGDSGIKNQVSSMDSMYSKCGKEKMVTVTVKLIKMDRSEK